jgi:hypothetical protein
VSVSRRKLAFPGPVTLFGAFPALALAAFLPARAIAQVEERIRARFLSHDCGTGMTLRANVLQQPVRNRNFTQRDKFSWNFFFSSVPDSSEVVKKGHYEDVNSATQQAVPLTRLEVCNDLSELPS